AGAALAAAGFTGDGTAFRSDAGQIGFVIPSSKDFDATSIESGSVRIGNHLAVLAPVSSRLGDLNGHQIEDLAVFFETASTSDLLARIEAGIRYPVGLRYETKDGTGYWIPDILALGPPLEIGPSGVGGGDQAGPLYQARPNPFQASTSVAYSLE